MPILQAVTWMYLQQNGVKISPFADQAFFIVRNPLNLSKLFNKQS